MASLRLLKEYLRPDHGKSRKGELLVLLGGPWRLVRPAGLQLREQLPLLRRHRPADDGLTRITLLASCYQLPHPRRRHFSALALQDLQTHLLGLHLLNSLQQASRATTLTLIIETISKRLSLRSPAASLLTIYYRALAASTPTGVLGGEVAAVGERVHTTAAYCRVHLRFQHP